MDRLSNCIYKCLWHLLHCFVSLYEFCMWLRLRILVFFTWSYDVCRVPAEREQSEYYFLQKCKKNLTKIPNHLNLIIGPENTEVNDELLTRIFSYALQMNINCISYYDTRYVNSIHTPKSSLTALEKLNCPMGWKRKNISAHHSVWYICNEKMSNGDIYKINGVNGSSSPSKSIFRNGYLSDSLTSSMCRNAYIEIYEIQPENNRSLLAQICRDLFNQRHTTETQNLLSKRTLLTERLNQELASRLENLTEPEISIIFNEDMCTFGMLPWHTRFTEFHLHRNGEPFNVKTFAHILHKYSRCEQRWGK